MKKPLLFFSFPLQFWLFKHEFAATPKKNVTPAQGGSYIFKFLKKLHFSFDDTSNEKRRGTKIQLKQLYFRKMKKVKISILALGESIRFRERE